VKTLPRPRYRGTRAVVAMPGCEAGRREVC
jgi:hypothetical protein